MKYMCQAADLQGLGFLAQGSGFRVEGLGLRGIMYVLPTSWSLWGSSWPALVLTCLRPARALGRSMVWGLGPF